MKAMVALIPVMGMLLSGCCGGCSKFWLDVQRGMYYEEKPYSIAQSAVERSFPESFTSTARIVLHRGGSENAFTVKLKRNSRKDELRIAAITDLGNVIFAAASQGNRVGIVKNNSGWPDTVISEVVVPLCRQLTARTLSKDCIVQRFPNGRYCYRTFTDRHEVVEVRLNDAGDKVSTVVTRAFAWYGEKEYVRRVHIAEYGTVSGSSSPCPKRLEIVDEIGGYRAEVFINRLEATP